MDWIRGVFLGAATFVSTQVLADESLPTGKDWVSDVNPSITNIDTAEVLSWLKDEPEVEFLDVRLAHEIAAHGWLEHRIGETIPDLNTPIVVYCSTNRRSPLAASTLQKMGYTNVKNYTNGFLSWAEEGLAIEATDYAVGNQLYREPIEVAPNVYSAIGATAPATFENSGHNNNLSFVVTEDGVLVVNAGDNYLLASALHDAIKLVTD